MAPDDIMFTPDDERGVAIRGLRDTLTYLDSLNPNEEDLDIDMITISPLAAHVMERYNKFSDARENSGVEGELTECHLAYNGEYSAKDLARIPDYGSKIFMNITSTKCSAGMSWIRDVLLQANGKRFDLKSSPVPDLPLKTLQAIEDYFREEEGRGTQAIEEEGQQDPNMPPQEQQQAQQGAGKIISATEKIRKMNELKRNIKESLYDEIMMESESELVAVKRIIEDDLHNGRWDDALNDFITDFCIYPTAFMKAPIITRKPKLTWAAGEAVVDKDSFVYLNKRVSPFDMYTDPSVGCLHDGDVIEHIRLSRSEVYSLIGVSNYKEDVLREVLQTGASMSHWYDSGIETDKAELEKRGTEWEMNEDVFHGIHFHGAVDGQKLLDWGIKDKKVDKDDPEKMYQVEVIMLGSEVVKCVLNDDPLGRKPYLYASFKKNPGSVWGRSIPNLMRDIQRMCNATARALADNMGLSSGPQMEVYIDRLADDGPISAMEPRKIWQLKSDPTGAGGRAIQWFNIPSNANELLTIYQDFEMKADDATGIPRYAYGNERSVGAASTAKGLAMLLESASKGIKDAIRNIDSGVIIPRIETQFYYTMLTRKDLKYSGDINVITYGSEAILLKAAQEAKRQEFLQTTANPIDQKIMGWAGRADILREAAKDLGFPHNLIPNKIELNKLEKEERDMEQKRLQIEAQKQSVGLQAVERQSQSNEKIAADRHDIERDKNKLKELEIQRKAQENLLKLKTSRESALEQGQMRLQETAFKEEQQNIRTNKNLAVDLQRSKNAAQSYVERGFK